MSKESRDSKLSTWLDDIYIYKNGCCRSKSLRGPTYFKIYIYLYTVLLSLSISLSLTLSLSLSLSLSQRRSRVDFYIWTYHCWLTSKDLHQLCANTECSLENLPGTTDDRDRCRERERERERESRDSVLSALDNDDDDDDGLHIYSLLRSFDVIVTFPEYIFVTFTFGCLLFSFVLCSFSAKIEFCKKKKKKKKERN